MSDKEKQSEDVSFELSKDDTITLGKNDAAIVCKGESIVLYFPSRPEDEPVGPNDLLCMALAGIMAHQPEVIMAELDRLEGLEDDQTVTSDTLKPDGAIKPEDTKE